jgi:Tol biopolymer transport system component
MKYNKTIAAACLFIASCITNCKDEHQPASIAYPQPAPDSIPLVFLPGLVSKDTLDFNSTFSVDGKTFFFSRSHNRKYVIFETSYTSNKWQEPVISPLFDTLYSNTDPFIAPDSALYFISNRPRDKNDTTADYDIYRLVKQTVGYGAPEYLNGVNSDSTEYYVSVSRTGNIYFSSYRDGNLDLYMSRKTNNGYEKPVNLGAVINSPYDEHDPLIAPDESFLVFPSDRPGGLGEADLYISHKINGQWQQPVAMGNGINTKRYEYCPYLTADGKYFFYSSEYQVKWISASVLKKKG